MLRAVGGFLLAFGAGAWGLALFGQVPVQAGVGVALMCCGVAFGLMPWWWASEAPQPAVPIHIEMPEKPVEVETVTAPVEEPQPVEVRGGVAKFMAECLTRADGQCVKIEGLLQAYSSWCEAKGLSAVGMDEFQQRVNDLCEAARIRRGKGKSVMNVALTE